MKKEYLKKIRLLKLSFFFIITTILFSSCSSNNELKELKNLYNSYREMSNDLIILFDNNFLLNRENATYILERTKKFEHAVLSYKENTETQYYNRLSSDTEIINGILDSIFKINHILVSITLNPNSIGEKQLKTFSINLNNIHSDMITLEFNRIITNERILSDYVKYFMIFIIFFLALCIVLLVIFIIELKQRDIKIIETSNFLDYTIKGQEEEKQRIARELHDTVAQDIRYIIHLTKKIETSNLQKDILERQNKCLKQIRNLCSSFIPQDIANKDLVSSINDVISNFKSQTDIEIKLTILDNIDFKNMPEEKLLHFFRIIQEILNNAKKHSHATEVTILIKKEIKNENNYIHLIITDDGVGIDSQILESIKEQKVSVAKNHFGIKNIIQRVKLLKGEIKFTSDKDFGTEISVIIPQ